MEIVKADYFGTCFGVERALNLTEKELEVNDCLLCYGELIHNNDVIDNYKLKGLQIIDNIDGILNENLVLRSHGVGKDIYKYCKENNINIIDATCPRVINIHNIVEEYCLNGYDIIIFGNSAHPEIIGIKGWCDKNVYVYDDLKHFKSSHSQGLNKLCVVFQTTYNIRKYNEIKEYFNNYDNNDIILKYTICNATNDRQVACEKLAKECDAVLIIGGKQSSNTKKLFEISKEICENTYWIENSKEIPFNLIKNTRRLGITAGASTPLWIIEEVIQNVRKE